MGIVLYRATNPVRLHELHILRGKSQNRQYLLCLPSALHLLQYPVPETAQTPARYKAPLKIEPTRHLENRQIHAPRTETHRKLGLRHPARELTKTFLPALRPKKKEPFPLSAARRDRLIEPFQLDLRILAVSAILEQRGALPEQFLPRLLPAVIERRAGQNASASARRRSVVNGACRTSTTGQTSASGAATSDANADAADPERPLRAVHPLRQRQQVGKHRPAGAGCSSCPSTLSSTRCTTTSSVGVGWQAESSAAIRQSSADRAALTALHFSPRFIHPPP